MAGAEYGPDRITLRPEGRTGIGRMQGGRRLYDRCLGATRAYEGQYWVRAGQQWREKCKSDDGLETKRQWL